MAQLNSSENRESHPILPRTLKLPQCIMLPSSLLPTYEALRSIADHETFFPPVIREDLPSGITTGDIGLAFGTEPLLLSRTIIAPLFECRTLSPEDMNVLMPEVLRLWSKDAVEAATQASHKPSAYAYLVYDYLGRTQILDRHMPPNLRAASNTFMRTTLQYVLLENGPADCTNVVVRQRRFLPQWYSWHITYGAVSSEFINLWRDLFTLQSNSAMVTMLWFVSWFVYPELSSNPFYRIPLGRGARTEGFLETHMCGYGRPALLKSNAEFMEQLITLKSLCALLDKINNEMPRAAFNDKDSARAIMAVSDYYTHHGDHISSRCADYCSWLRGEKQGGLRFSR